MISYVDVGAHHGDVLRAIVEKGSRIGEALLVEPNPSSFKVLEARVEELQLGGRVHCRNMALGAAPGRLQLRAADDMTRAPGPAGADLQPVAEHVFEVEATTLDAIVGDLRKPRINLLKIDVGGYEAEVLAGATNLLADQAIDMIYVEAAMGPDGAQQTYYRVIEDALGAYGYRLFRIFELLHEWPENSPLLRRCSLAFMSPRFSAAHPYRLCTNLLALHMDGIAAGRGFADCPLRHETAEQNQHRRALQAAPASGRPLPARRASSCAVPRR